MAAGMYLEHYLDMCEEHIRLLFTVLERSSLPVVRGNAIIGLGDLTVRFSNILEPWTQSLYPLYQVIQTPGPRASVPGNPNTWTQSLCTRLSDENPAVRQTVVTVLTQLVLKVKGQVSEVAVLLIDPPTHIASLALNFFSELASKTEGNGSSQDNAIYNLLPDIISRLSDPERAMNEEDFHTIMKPERQWCDLAVSLFEKRLTAVHTQGLENIESPEMEKTRPEGAGPSQNTTTHTPLPNKGRGGRPKRGQAKPSVSSRHDDSFVTPKPTRRSSKKAVITFSSDEEEEDAVVAESETPKVTTPIARTSRRACLRHCTPSSSAFSLSHVPLFCHLFKSCFYFK
eukprot:XP_014008883.1 PREDICTED: condensin complex subunit 1-like [Salmo salar]